MQTKIDTFLCSLRLHDWRYRWRRLPHGRGVMLYRTCSDCGSQQKARIISLADTVMWADVRRGVKHYESLLRKCKPVTCPKCGTVHYHIDDEEGEDAVEMSDAQPVDPNQLRLFA